MTDVFFKHTVTGTMPAALNTFLHQHPQLSLSPFYTRGSRHPQSGKLRKFVGTVNILRNSDSRINVIPEPIFLTIMLFCPTKKKKNPEAQEERNLYYFRLAKCNMGVRCRGPSSRLTAASPSVPRKSQNLSAFEVRCFFQWIALFCYSLSISIHVFPGKPSRFLFACVTSRRMDVLYPVGHT